LEEQYNITHHKDDISGSEDFDDEELATDEGKVETSARPRHHQITPSPPILFPITDSVPVRRPSSPSTDGISTRGLPTT